MILVRRLFAFGNTRVDLGKFICATWENLVKSFVLWDSTFGKSDLEKRVSHLRALGKPEKNFPSFPAFPRGSCSAFPSGANQATALTLYL